MAGSVDEVQLVGDAGTMLVVDAYRVGFDRDPAFPLEIHLIEHLIAHIALCDGAGPLQQAVGEGRFAVVDMGNDGEVADARLVGHEETPGRVGTEAVYR